MVSLYPGTIRADVGPGPAASRRFNINDFDVAPDDRALVFSATSGESAFLYVINLDGTGFRALTWAAEETHGLPRLSNDGQKVLFLSFPKIIAAGQKPESRLYQIDYDGQNQKQLVGPRTYITEAIYGRQDGEVLFLQADEFRSDAPVSVPKAHRIDLYSLKVATGEITRLTHFSAYEMSNLSLAAGGKKVILKLGGTVRNGIYAFEIGKPNSEILISPRTLAIPDNVIEPALSPDGTKLAFVSPSNSSGTYRYELFLNSLVGDSSRATQLTQTGKVVHNIRFLRKTPRMLFLREPDYPEASPRRELMEIGMDGKNLKLIDLRAP